MNKLHDLEPKDVMYFFEEISKIPRCSGNEKAISDYCAKIAKENALDFYQDDAHNIIIYKPGSAGFEDAAPVIIQGHLDMVCVKNKDVKHNFSKDGLELQIDDDYISAKGTSLGADNGIAVAMGLALIIAKDAVHPPLEIVFTADEEVGMTGATALDASKLSAKLMINLDGGPENFFIAGCAGGARVSIKIPNTWEIRTYPVTMNLSISGLKGGHSGLDIGKQRANANYLLFSLLDEIKKTSDYQVRKLSGGDKDNAIARESSAVLCVRQDDVKKIAKRLEALKEVYKNIFAVSDPDLEFYFEEIEDEYAKVLSEETVEKAINMVLLTPDGVWSRDMHFDGLVEASNNFGVLEMTDDEIRFTNAVRSSIEQRKTEIVSIIGKVAKLNGLEAELTSNYPGWQYNPDSKLVEHCKKTYSKIFDGEAEVATIHAGLECGLFGEKIPDLDSVSFGPLIHDYHSPMERLSISSTERTWKLLLEILKDLRL